MASARAETGLGDFGDPWFEAPLARLVDEVAAGWSGLAG